MSRSVMRFADWMITQDRSEGAPTAPIYEMECTTCATLDAPDGAGCRSPASEDPIDAQDWAMKHSGRHLTHRHFRGIVTDFWRTSMLDEPTPPALSP